MRSADSEQWTATTHLWTQEVDLDHLTAVRNAREVFARGGRRHQMLEILAYADDEAEALGRKGRATVEVAANGCVSISDDGRGTDTRRDTQGRRSHRVRVARNPVPR